MRRLALVIPIAAVAALVAGCGGGTTRTAGSGSSSVTPPPATVTDTVVPPTTSTSSSSSSSTSTTTTVAPSGSATGDACPTADLTVTLGQPEGTAGGQIYPVHFVNHGGGSCTMTGFPGISYVAPGNGMQIGVAAVRSNAGAPTVTLSSGAEATAMLKASNYEDYSPAACDATYVSGFRVYPPGNTAAAYVAFPSRTKACSTGSSQLQVQPVAAGSGG